MPWSAEKMMVGQDQRVDIPDLPIPDLRWPQLEKTGRRSLLNCTSCPTGSPVCERTELNCLTLSLSAGTMSKIFLSFSLQKT